MESMKQKEVGVKNLRALMLLSGVFMAAILAANTLASKLFEVGGFVMTAGIVAFPITFMVTDIVNEVWGRRVAQSMVLAGLLANVIMLALYRVGIALPAAGFWGGQEAFVSILGEVPRIVLASMTAYLISQTWDVWLFDTIKRKLSLGLWFRNNLSTATSQLIDSAVFLTIAFGGVMPASDLMVMFVTYVAVKFMIAIADTPLVYLGVALIRRGDRAEYTFDTDTTRASGSAVKY